MVANCLLLFVNKVLNGSSSVTVMCMELQVGRLGTKRSAKACGLFEMPRDQTVEDPYSYQWGCQSAEA